MLLKIKRIYFDKPNIDNEYVTYENQLQTRYIFGNDTLEQLFKTHEEDIIQMTEKYAIYYLNEYFNDENYSNNDLESFPVLKYLTGEWYLREVSFEDIDYLSIEMAFLGTDLGYKDDYLGIEVLFCYDENLKQFIFDGLNSEVI